MGRSDLDSRKRTVVKTYGRGSLLGFLSVPFAFLMARQGMHGWQDSAIREMEDDAITMARDGYQVVDTQQYGWPQIGVVYFKVTYELAGSPGDPRQRG